MATARAAITSPAQADGRRTCWPVLARRRAEIDRQSGVTSSRAGPSSALSKPRPRLRMTHTGAEYEDSGGASRFFPVFRYEAKASSAERPRLEDGTTHERPSNRWPSCRWLVRLITPPGGLVADLFAVERADRRGLHYRGLPMCPHREGTALCELIRQRLCKDIQPVMFGEEIA